MEMSEKRIIQFKEKKKWYKKGYDDREAKIVRCKDCKHRPYKPDNYKNGFDLEFPDYVCPCQCSDGFYSWYPKDDWFCASGERG